MRAFVGRDRFLVGGGAAACAVCCAPPLLALAGIAGAGTVATLATLALAGLVFAVVVAGLSVFALLLRKRHRDRPAGPPGKPHEAVRLPGPALRREAR
jgi:hypothetical protein